MALEDKETKKKKDSIWKHAKIGTPEYKRPTDLWNDALLYFEWCDENPVDAPINVIRYKKEKHGGSKEMKKQDQQENISRPYTLYGFCAFTGITKWSSFKAKMTDPEKVLRWQEFENVIMTIENVIASQQIDGAMTGVFRENLTARLNGLADKNQQEISGETEVKHNFTGFNFLPSAKDFGLEAPSPSAIEQPEKEKQPIYAEIVDYESVEPQANTGV